MKFKHIILGCLLMAGWAQATEPTSTHQVLSQINQFQMVSKRLASAASPELQHFQSLKDAGFEHIIILSTGLHLVEKTHAEALGMTFEQIKVPLTEPSDAHFSEFKKLMGANSKGLVFVYSEQNWRASTYAYRFNSIQEDAGLLAKN